MRQGSSSVTHMCVCGCVSAQTLLFTAVRSTCASHNRRRAQACAFGKRPFVYTGSPDRKIGHVRQAWLTRCVGAGSRSWQEGVAKQVLLLKRASKRDSRPESESDPESS